MASHGPRHPNRCDLETDAVMLADHKWPAYLDTVLETSGRHLVTAFGARDVGSASGIAIGGVYVPAGASTVLFVPAGARLAVRTRDHAVQAFSASIAPNAVTAICPGEAPRWRPMAGENSPRIAETIRWLHLANGARGGSPDPLVLRLLIRLVANAFGGVVRRIGDSWLPAPALARVSGLTAGDGLADTSLATLAMNAGLGQSAFSRAFRGSTGITAGEHLRRARIARVATLVETTDLSLAEITRRVGLSSVAHVSQQFEAWHGMGVRHFRARLRADVKDQWTKPSGEESNAL